MSKNWVSEINFSAKKHIKEKYRHVIRNNYESLQKILWFKNIDVCYDKE